MNHQSEFKNRVKINLFTQDTGEINYMKHKASLMDITKIPKN